MNTKKIAKLLLGLAYSFDTNDPDTTNHRADTLRQIANEIEPQPEPQPEPAFKVGDWVEIEVAGVISQQRVRTGVFSDRINAGGFEFYSNGLPVMKPLNARITRKLDPTEVVIHIGCLSGTVEKAQDYAYFLLWHSKTDCDYSMIKWSAIDTPTRELVESLLDAQDEK